jgi:NAD(P)-dependent dehydrogenase (short-subunit alcohol dehydrogenase family)
MNPSTTAKHLTILTGASRGMGLAMAEQLLAPDRVLLCISRKTHDGLAQMASTQGASLTQWQQDLADTQGAAQRLQDWLTTQLPAGLASATLINNAGVLTTIGPLEAAPPEGVINALRVGLEAPMLLTAAFLRVTGEWVNAGWRGPRKVLNISSGLGRHAMAGQASYCAAKAGMDHFTRGSALDEAEKPFGAKLVSLAPGVIDTDMQTQLRAGDPAQFPTLARFIGLKEGGQLSTPEQAAKQVLGWLDRSDFGAEPVADVRD